MAYRLDVVDASGLRADVQIHLLGPLELVLDGRLVPTGGPRQRALLALLALSVGVAVSPSRLVDLLWGEVPPPAAANTVQVYVSRLRRSFTANGGIAPLRNVSGAYLLDLPPDAVDVGRFEALSERGRAGLLAADPVTATADLRAALALWRGPALPDLAETTVARAAVARLESMRLAVLADRIDAEACLGRHSVLIPELEELVVNHPLDERFVGQLMTALYRVGRQAEAFAAYRLAADRLVEELGVDPGPALRALHTRILRQDVDLDRPGAARAQPRAVPEELISASLIGRRVELAAILELIDRPEAGLITVIGPPGVGKTRLVLEVVALLRAAASAGPGSGASQTVFVSLAAVSDAGQVPAEICRALEVAPDWPGEPAVDVAVRALLDGPVVVVLDNLEPLVDGDLGGVAELLARSVGLTVLATSRAVLGVPGERPFALGPLPVPPPIADRNLGRVASVEAVQLFRERARRVLPSFEVTAANAAVVAALCRALEGLPLALELAAAQVRVLLPEEILRRLERRRDLPAGEAATPVQRQGSLWAVLDWSARTLDPAELVLFGQLSVFVGGWTVDAAVQVCGSATDPELIIGQVLDRLADKNLLVVEGTGRLTMVDTVRAYAQEVLAADPLIAAGTRDRQAAYFARLAETLGPNALGPNALGPNALGPGSRGGMGSAAGLSPRAELDREAGNLRVALERAAGDRVAGDRVDGELLGRMVAALLDHWTASGRWGEVDHWFQAARRATLSPVSRARLLLSAGDLAISGGNLAVAAEVLAQAHEAARQFADPGLVVRTVVARAAAARGRGRPESALDLLTEALDELAGRAEALQALSGRAGAGLEGAESQVVEWERALKNELASVLYDLDRGPEAVELWQEARRAAVAQGNPGLQVHPLLNLARVALDRGAADEAAEVIAQAFAAAVATESPPLLAAVLAVAGLVDHRGSRPAPALARLRASIRLSHECGQLRPLPELVALLGSALVNDEPVVAARLLAVAEAWRTGRSLAMTGRSAPAAISAAEATLAAAVAAGKVSSEQVAAERARGARTPFGSLLGLCRLDPGLRLDPRPVDLTGARIDSDVIDLRGLPQRG